MSDNTAERWPHFELVSLSEPTGIPHGWDAELLRQEVPKNLFGQSYQAANELTLLEDPDSGQFVCFGASGLFGKICLNPRTGAVVEITYVPAGSTNSANEVLGPPSFVNSSLAQFTASVRAVFNRFPFDSGDTEEDRERGDRADEWAHADKLENQWDQAVGELTEILRRIDPAAVADEYTFWRTFLDDVQMGNFATKDIVGEGDE